MQTPNEVGELRLLFEISRILDDPSEMAASLDGVLELLGRRTAMRRGAISLVDEKRGEIVVDAAWGLGDKARRSGRYRLGEGVTGAVIRSGQPMIVPNVQREPLFLNRTGVWKRERAATGFVCVPVRLESRVVGALWADRLFGPPTPIEEDMRLLTVVASLVARAVRTRQALAAAREEARRENTRLRAALAEQFRPDAFVGASPALYGVLEQIARVAGTGATVLLYGESGTGKELAARTIHAHSPRAGFPLVCVNCAAVPEALVESELFGHERGAFTGAERQRRGRFESAAGGTIFLDEVGELSLAAQAKFLRVLQEHEFERVGGAQTLKADARVIAATNRDLERMVAEGAFREDLFYRLNVFPIRLPPLRERREDIAPLTAFFLEKFGRELGRPGLSLDERVPGILERHSWPGNIRELENIIERAAILAQDGVVRPGHLPEALRNPGTPERGRTLPEALRALEEAMIREALDRHGGHMGAAARALGVTERVLGLRMRKFGLTFKMFRRK